MPQMMIRPAHNDDIPVLLQLIRQLADSEHFPDPVTVNAERLQQHLFGNKAVAEALLIEMHERVIGYAIFYMTFASSTGTPGLHLDDLFVLPAAQGQGIGKRIMQHITQLARERGCTRVEWWTLRHNIQAQEFYQQMGADHKTDLMIYRLDGEKLRNF